MGDSFRFRDNLVITCGSHEAAFVPVSFSLPPSAEFWIGLFVRGQSFWIGPFMRGQSFLDQPPSRLQDDWAQSAQADLGFSQKGCDTPLFPSHAGDKGDLFTRQLASKNTSRAELDCAQSLKSDLRLNQKSNHGQRPVDVVCVTAALCKEEGKAAASVPSKNSAIAAVPASQPNIVNTNGTTIDGVPIANASIARAADQLFGFANFSSENASLEENSTFKWLKRTLYQPQCLASGVDKGQPLIADGNANDSFGCWSKIVNEWVRTK
ncbi:hypothetical protein HYV85_00570 [Candidatus Woesearchaeota archaeon]|nr:hypothetical protein [Candidatus Woesearchaeota archaeon]